MYVWTFNINEKLIKFSRSLREPEFTETLETYFAGMDEKNRHDAMQVMKETVMQGKPFTAVHEFQETPVNKQHAWYSISGMPVHEKDGSVKEYFGLVRNITDLMKAQQLLRDETLRADDSGRMKSAFLANMTHEIRTPLNAIVGFSDLLQVVETSEERKEFIRIIRNNCDMLLRLINDILEASSMGQSLAIEAEAIDLSHVFDDICQTLAQRVENPNVEFQKDNPYDSCPAVLDKGRLQQLLTNFVTNAVKYTEQGHIRVGYQKSAKPSKDGEIPTNPKKLDGFYFYCEDTGAGIPKEKQADVFKRFVKLNDFVQGTGLGLSICQAIVEKCGGKIGVKGDVGVGSTFWFWIPREMKDLKD
jgi:signal transduction histidine kinase